MRRIFTALAALALFAAVIVHLGGAEIVAELCGDFAFFTLLIAVLVPEPRQPQGQASR